ncbi:lens epithelium-derived growth factor-like [Myxocyprinus asiaticus]|uniref:lens epithelium-derived growth factor-like n=1 Tax=Myxocyprinus asiaticus TaxID=70543 RepID=UPI002223E214|nr:lens epithelium-derived growth factor-like [Myxocyprinus asiaticus]XP_051518348.1 lens epithelium-derived growth factor-like [Myxocyprinus asiaticus]XP_051518349.1 lens epithelium-derived growth factor-like [Myxocyprinus asiaticus]XP_051518350.1 lens epithelium-derived growth factor-like [Myxocyprinus asiaticus]XP_051518351.1 lens epithelium-derived growth factor-like [Myxocyprinus asiaticus]XP_051518352.1 lens epithelium-derived growth factor-like [Myxocyprinus asiaticus]XP_051518353.1 le
MKVKSDQITHDFTPGDIVFAKMKGYPFWPARIGEGKAPQNKIHIFFYGTHSTTFLFPKDIVHYWPNKEKYGQTTKRGGFEEGMWEIENDPGVGVKGQKKSALVKRLAESRLKFKKKKAVNQSGKKSQTVSCKESLSKSDSKSVTTNKRETPVKISSTPKTKSETGNEVKTAGKMSTRSRDSGGQTPVTRARRTSSTPLARKGTSVKTVTSGKRMLPSRKIILARRAAAAKMLSARRKHVLHAKIISTVTKMTDTENQKKPLRITRSSADLIKTKADVTERSVKPASLKRKRSQTESYGKRDSHISLPTANSSTPSSPTGSKRKRRGEEETSVPDEPEKNETKKRKREEKEDHRETENKSTHVKSDVLSIFEKQEKKDEKTPRDEERCKILAEKRQSVLRSLQGLVTSTRGKTQTSTTEQTTTTKTTPQEEEQQKRPARNRGVRCENRSPMKPTEEEKKDTARNGEQEVKNTETTPHEEVQKRPERNREVRCENHDRMKPKEDEKKEPEKDVEQEVKNTEQQNNNSTEDESRDRFLSITDSLLYRLHDDIRISMTLDNPDVSKCLLALDELSTVPVSSRHIQNHSELIDTLRKMRWFRGSEAIMFKASMLYHRFKNIYLIGDGDETLSQEYINSLQVEREKESRETGRQTDRCWSSYQSDGHQRKDHRPETCTLNN